MDELSHAILKEVVSKINDQRVWPKSPQIRTMLFYRELTTKKYMGVFLKLAIDPKQLKLTLTKSDNSLSSTRPMRREVVVDEYYLQEDGVIDKAANDIRSIIIPLAEKHIELKERREKEHKERQRKTQKARRNSNNGRNRRTRRR